VLGILKLAFRAIEQYLATLTLAASVALGLLDIVLRYLFGLGFPWGEGIVVLLALTSTFLGASGAVATDQHLRFDLVLKKVFGRRAALVQASTEVLLCLFLLYLGYLALQFTLFELQSGEMSFDTYLPVWVNFAVLTTVVLMMVIRYAQRALRTLRHLSS
jgi:TRAP-type C4-dicarboxylate transport system permease small subunit